MFNEWLDFGFKDLDCLDFYRGVDFELETSCCYFVDYDVSFYLVFVYLFTFSVPYLSGTEFLLVDFILVSLPSYYELPVRLDIQIFWSGEGYLKVNCLTIWKSTSSNLSALYLLGLRR